MCVIWEMKKLAGLKNQMKEKSLKWPTEENEWHKQFPDQFNNVMTSQLTMLLRHYDVMTKMWRKAEEFSDLYYICDCYVVRVVGLYCYLDQLIIGRLRLI